MTDRSLPALLSSLEVLTDRQRLDFAMWADTQPTPVSRNEESGRAYLDLSEAEDTANRALGVFHHDGTVTDAEGQMFFDPTFGQGRDAWRAAEVLVRAMVRSVMSGSDRPSAALVAAFERLSASE